MSGISLKFLNEKEPNVIQYLPYGVTTLEMKILGDQKTLTGYIYPKNRSDGENNFYVGYVDENYDAKNFLVLWGAGRREGLKNDRESADHRLFLQVLHHGSDISSPTITFEHSETILPIGTVTLEPAEKSSNLVRMDMNKEDDSYIISFTGNRVPLYYSRWFPPRPSENKRIQYGHIKVPQISIKFKADRDKVSQNVTSDIDIIMDDDKIAQISGDWRYGWPHTELFTVFGDERYLVLRFWLYWIHENYSKNVFMGGKALLEETEDYETRLALWESLDIEVPDIERFDFLIDMNVRKVIWIGTDFHYQEAWFKLKRDEAVAEARIANDVETLVQIFRRLKDRFDPPKNYDPMNDPKTGLKKMLRDKDETELRPEYVQTPEEYTVTNVNHAGNVFRGPATLKRGLTRKHVPYIKNGSISPKMVSSIVTS